jgi:hypothetical protein
MQLTREDIRNKVQYHYRYELEPVAYNIVDILLFKDHSFQFASAGCMASRYSTGYWKKSKDTLILNSDIQMHDLPISISYRQRDSSDVNIKRIGFLKDSTGKVIDYAFIYINNDSTSCTDGDLMCIGEYENIDSVKVQFENGGISSKWVPIRSFNGILQVKIDTNKDLREYMVLTNNRYKIYNNRVRLIEK